MNRRTFLAWLAGTAAGAAAAHTLDLEKLLWVPGQKNIFIPPPPTILTDRQTGIAIRLIQQWDIRTDYLPTRMDGWAPLSLWVPDV